MKHRFIVRCGLIMGKVSVWDTRYNKIALNYKTLAKAQARADKLNAEEPCDLCALPANGPIGTDLCGCGPVLA
jgi:hypothetical protein